MSRLTDGTVPNFQSLSVPNEFDGHFLNGVTGGYERSENGTRVLLGLCRRSSTNCTLYKTRSKSTKKICVFHLNCNLYKKIQIATLSN